MLRITQSFLDAELSPLVGIFTFQDVRTAYEKGMKRLWKTIGGERPAGSKLVKVYLTSKTSAWRILFAFFVSKDIWIPVIFRTKNDKVGKNFSPANPHFEKTLLRAFDEMEADILNGSFEDFE